MPWYKSGTASVTQNSNAVIGAGTAFIANSRVGDAFRGPDGGWYEVTNIASDTALSISPNYQGATNAAGVYALAPMQGYVKDSADALRALVNTYGTKLAMLGTTGNYEVLPVIKGGTGSTTASAARTELGLATPIDISDAHLALTLGVTYRLVAPYTNSVVTGFPCSIIPLRYDNEATLIAVQEGVVNPTLFMKKRTGPSTWSGWFKLSLNTVLGANNDITSLSGLTTPISVAQGGTGANNPAAARAALALKTAAVFDLLGTVSQSGGNPTGAIIETATNANGTYTKFADGTLICQGPMPDFAVAAGAVATVSSTATFPALFINTSYYFECAGAPNASNDIYGFTGVNAKAVHSGTRVFRNGAAAQSIINCRYLAIGRWF
ncbi:phage tail protein [Pseudomonas svalbardensis]|uniref:phage tail protein n=1 Tax=Pseudomonas svalbardensis TaxID=3042029 RepID=UPI0024B33B22|nr:phage tail protein [Pseudomonas sp. PMCC200367]